jgi:chemotaxis signal transduction protein
MNQTNVKGMMFDAEVAPLLPRMDSVNDHREALQRLQDNWEHLTLLGQLSGIAADITATGDEFKSLSGRLLNALAHRLLDNVVQGLQGKAQVAIDILVRNLFERTADVGFLATDTAICEALASGAAPEAIQHSLHQRLQAYVAKYSVYDDVLVLSAEGEVLARLDTRVAATHSTHRFVAEALSGQQAFVECFDQVDVLGGRRALVYAAPIHAGGAHRSAVLGLSFRLDDEMAGIFAHLIDRDPFQVLLLCNEQGEVIGSSDDRRVHVGARLSLDPDRAGHQCVFHGGRLYLAVCTRSAGYQGYGGPGWLGCALIPLENAFDTVHAALMQPDAAEAAEDQGAPAIDASAFFDEDLLVFPQQARQIQKGLARSAWNWELHTRRQTGEHAAADNRFAAALLLQVSQTGERIRQVFEGAITELGASVAASVLRDATFRASLAIDIMDRNLYERANDCRWWSMDGAVRRALRQREPATQRKACEVLAHINSLYTVYTRLVLLDPHGEVVAISTDDHAAWLGRRLQLPWLQAATQLPDHQAWTHSAFEATPLYDDRPTYVYAAAVHGDDGRPMGAIAIVFDAAPQFEAMLRDVVPAGDGAMSALFVTRAGQVIASSDGRLQPGQSLPWSGVAWQGLQAGQATSLVMPIDGTPHAVGVTLAAGYREYKGGCMGRADDVLALVLRPIRQPIEDTDVGGAQGRLRVAPGGAQGERLALACFVCADQHLGLDADRVIEALSWRRLTAVPGSPSHLAGLLMHQARMLPVLDLRVLRGQGPHPEGAAALRLLVVCESSDGFRFGLAVDDLAGILSVPESARQPLPDGLARHDPSAVGIVRGQADGGAAPMLTLLDIDRLAWHIHGRVVAPPVVEGGESVQAGRTEKPGACQGSQGVAPRDQALAG